MLGARVIKIFLYFYGLNKWKKEEHIFLKCMKTMKVTGYRGFFTGVFSDIPIL